MKNGIKEFGKLSLAQLQDLSNSLPELMGLAVDLPELIKAKPDKFAQIMGTDFSWATIYELPFVQQAATLFVLLGIQDKIHQAAAASDPQERVLEWTKDGGELDQWLAENEDKLDKRLLVILAVVCHRNIHSLMLNQCSLDVLVSKVRQGDDKAFFDAVRIDRSILSCTPFADRLSKAELEDDAEFFHDLGLALKGPRERPSSDKMINFLMAALHEAGVTSLSDDRWQSLFSDDLELVESGPDSDPVEALKQRFNRVRQKSKT